MTVCWHVDDLKVSHCDPAQVTIFGEPLSTKYGVTVATHRGKVHAYLGMIFDFLAKGKVMVTMMEYIKTILNNFPEESMGSKTSPAVDHLFTVRDPSLANMLPEEQVMAFNRATAQLLFLRREGALRYSGSHCLSHHVSEVSRQRRLGQGQEDAELPEGYYTHGPHSVRRFTDALTVVGRCSIRCSR